MLIISDSGFNHASIRFKADMQAELQLGKKVKEITGIQDL